MVNISALNNLSQPDLNTTALNNSENITNEMIRNANESSDGNLGVMILLPIFLVLFYFFTKDDGFFRLDLIHGGAAASGLTLLIGIALVVPGLITSYRQVIWFAVMLSAFVVAALLKK